MRSDSNEALRLLLWKKMVFIRLVEERIASEYHKQAMRCPIHLSIGQEATAVGICACLSDQDRVFSTHRCHSHYLALGGSLDEMIAELHGKITGCNGGRGGSMHLSAINQGLLASVPIVASSIPLAAGTALADKIDNRDSISVSFFGDACMEEGVFFETINFAQLNSLPILFVCENNFFSVYTSIDRRQSFGKPEKTVASFGVKTFRADGNDVLDVYDVASAAIEYIRRESAPAFLVADTYRWREHCGPNYDDHLGYRDQKEVSEWLARDPIEKEADELRNLGSIDDKVVAQVVDDINSQLDRSFLLADEANFPESQLAEFYVYDDR